MPTLRIEEMSNLYLEAGRVLGDVVSHRKGLKTAAMADEELPCKVGWGGRAARGLMVGKFGLHSAVDGVLPSNCPRSAHTPPPTLPLSLAPPRLQRATYALVCETLKFKAVIDEILAFANLKQLVPVRFCAPASVCVRGCGWVCAGVRASESVCRPTCTQCCGEQPTKDNRWVTYVALYDHLFGTGIRGGGALKRQILDNKVGLDDARPAALFLATTLIALSGWVAEGHLGA
jgi:hypothetical protein